MMTPKRLAITSKTCLELANLFSIHVSHIKIIVTLIGSTVTPILVLVKLSSSFKIFKWYRERKEDFEKIILEFLCLALEECQQRNVDKY